LREHRIGQGDEELFVFAIELITWSAGAVNRTDAHPAVDRAPSTVARLEFPGHDRGHGRLAERAVRGHGELRTRDSAVGLYDERRPRRCRSCRSPSGLGITRRRQWRPLGIGFLRERDGRDQGEAAGETKGMEGIFQAEMKAEVN